MYCKHCGALLNDEDMFCPHCGASVKDGTSGAPASPPPPYPGIPAIVPTNTLAIVGFILSFFVPIAGLICSILGYQNVPRYRGNGKNFAIAGITISSVAIALALILIIVYIALFIRYGYFL